MTALLVLVGGALGAMCRFTVDRAVTNRAGTTWPWGTFTVNVTASTLLGLLAGAGAALPGWLGALAGTGFCGALSTYSTFGHETVRLLDDGPTGRWRALLNVTATLVVGVAAAAAGRVLTAG